MKVEAAQAEVENTKDDLESSKVGLDERMERVGNKEEQHAMRSLQLVELAQQGVDHVECCV